MSVGRRFSVRIPGDNLAKEGGRGRVEGMGRARTLGSGELAGPRFVAALLANGAALWPILAGEALRVAVVRAFTVGAPVATRRVAAAGAVVGRRPMQFRVHRQDVVA